MFNGVKRLRLQSIALLVNTAKQALNKQTLVFFFIPWVHWVHRVHKATTTSFILQQHNFSSAFDLTLYGCISVISFIYSPSVSNESQKCLIVSTAVLKFTLSSCPVLLSHSSSDSSFSPFFLPSLLFSSHMYWQCKQSTFYSICLSFLLISASLNLSKVSNQTSTASVPMRGLWRGTQTHFTRVMPWFC